MMITCSEIDREIQAWETAIKMWEADKAACIAALEVRDRLRSRIPEFERDIRIAKGHIDELRASA